MKSRGFTLIEVMVAVFVIALGVGALLTTLVSSAQTVGYLREKSFAQWIALNRLAEVRLGTRRPQPGVTRDTVEFAGSNWRWEQEISDAGIKGLLRVDVRVARIADDVAPAQEEDEDAIVPSGSAVGFIGTSVARPSGITPDWNPRAPGPGPGGPGGDDGDGGGPGGPGGPSGPGGPDGGREDGPGGPDNQQ